MNMKKLTSIFVVLTIVLSSCTNEKSLNKYFVEKSAQEGFMSLTIPASILQLKTDENSDEAKDAMASFERLNVLILRNTDSLKVDFNKEQQTVENILANDKNLNELMSLNAKGYFVTVNFKGDENDISEVIAFAKGKEGFALARITGKNITAEKIAKVASSVDFNNSNIQELANLKIN